MLTGKAVGQRVDMELASVPPSNEVSEEEIEEEFVWDDPDSPEHRDRPFNAWRVPRSNAAQEVVTEVVGQLQSYELRFELRERKRRVNDQEIFEHTVSAVICDLIYHYLLRGSEQRVFITLSKEKLGRKSKYRSPAMTTVLPDILKRLSSPELSFIHMVKGERRAFGTSPSTTIQAGPHLITLVKSHDLSLSDLGRKPGGEVIHLKREKGGYWDGGELAEYTDTDTTRVYRQQVQDINSWLESLDIEFNDLVLESDTKVVDTLDRSMRRIFSMGRFDCSGRLFGGFWQELKKKERADGLHLNGERIVELDYGQMGPRILYGMCGATPPEHDAYILPGFERYRKGVKKVFNSVVFDDWSEKPRSRMPKKVRPLIPKRYSVHDVIHAIKEAHPAIAEAFGTGVGHNVMFHESQILVALLLQCRERDIPALPIHDAVLVPYSMQDDAQLIMLQVFKEKTGVEGKVTVEG